MRCITVLVLVVRIEQLPRVFYRVLEFGNLDRDSRIQEDLKLHLRFLSSAPMASKSSKDLPASELLLLLMPFVFHFVFYKFVFECFGIQGLLDFLGLSVVMMFFMSNLILDSFDRCKMITALRCLVLLHMSFVT